jgi:hypothetical protein
LAEALLPIGDRVPVREGESTVVDVALIVATLAFFGVALLYVGGCERILRQEKSHGR